MPSKKPIPPSSSAPLLGNESFRMAVESAFNHIIITDAEGTVLFANAAAETMTGYSKRELIGSNPSIWGSQMDAQTYEKMWHTLKSERKPFRGEFTNKRKNGERYTAKVVISPIIDERGALIGFIGTEEDVTREREAARMKTEFVSITSHQLLTPLAAMKWAIEMLEKESAHLDGDQIDLLSTIDATNERLIRLVTLLLNIAILESGTFIPALHRCEIAPILTQAKKDLGRLAETREISINVQTPNSTAAISGDSHLLLEAIENLLSNAIKYSEKGGDIDLRMEEQTERVIVTIRDRGIGIPASDKEKVFSKFFRASNAVSGDAGGSGLGLYFTQMVVRAHRGTISFDSAEGEGTTFTISFPKAPSGMVKE